MRPPRNLTIDITRGLTVLIMPAVHTTLLYSNPSVRNGPLGLLLSIFTTGPGATLLMFLMGFSFVFARKRSIATIAKRFWQLIVLAYLINFLKFGLPSLIGLFPNKFYAFYGIRNNIFGLLKLLAVGDIFQFVAIMYPICAILNRFRHGFLIAGALSCFIILFAPAFWGHRPGFYILDYFAYFFNGFPPAVYYPVFPWGAYPLSGLFFGYLMLNMDLNNYKKLLLKLGAVFASSGAIFKFFEPAFHNASFYRLGPGGTIFHLGLVLLWIRLCYHLTGKIKNTRILALLAKLSTHITLIYIIQWLLVCWFLPLFGFQNLGLVSTLMAIVFISVLSFGLSLVLTKVVSKRYQIKATQMDSTPVSSNITKNHKQ